MTAMLFVLIAVVLVVIALAFVVVPLARATRGNEANTETDAAEERLAVLSHGLSELDADFDSGTVNKSEYDEARRELEQQALEADSAAREQAASARRTSWRAAMTFGVALPMAAIVLYAVLGTPAALWRMPGAAVTIARGGPHGANVNMAAMTERLAQRLEKNSNDLEAWLLLARSYHTLGRLRDSVAAYKKAVALSPDNADLLIEYANTLAIAQGRDLSGKPMQLIKRALAIDPANLNALALAGAAALQAGRRQDAIRYWTHLKRLLPNNAPGVSQIKAWLARARGKNVVALAHTAIHGQVVISDALASQVSPSDTLFIFAKAANGPPMPLAIIRSSPTNWPVSFTLDNSKAMMPNLRLSQFSRVNVVARISRTGSAQPQPGDLQGRLEAVALGSDEVRIVIDTRIGN